MPGSGVMPRLAGLMSRWKTPWDLQVDHRFEQLAAVLLKLAHRRPTLFGESRGQRFLASVAEQKRTSVPDVERPCDESHHPPVVERSQHVGFERQPASR